MARTGRVWQSRGGRRAAITAPCVGFRPRKVQSAVANRPLPVFDDANCLKAAPVTLTSINPPPRPEAPLPPAGLKAGLRILATTDLHMHLTGHDYVTDRPDPARGLTRLATLIAEARAEAGDRTVLLLDNGDALQGSPLGEVALAAPDSPHPWAVAVAELGYDAIGLGNHDFDYGLDLVDRLRAAVACPVLSANLMRDRAPFAPVAALDRTVRAGGADWAIRIGLFSVLPPGTSRWNAHHLDGQARTTEILPAARLCRDMLAKAGSDVVVALAHTGIGAYEAVRAEENAGRPLGRIDGIDAMVLGHTHLCLPGPAHDGLTDVDADRGTISGRPAVMPGWAAGQLGVIDLDLQADADGRWRCTGHSVALRRLARPGPPVAEAPSLSARLAPIHAETRHAMDRVVGATSQRLHSYFAMVGEDRGLALVAAAQAAALRKAVRGTPLADLPLVSAAAPARTGGRGGPGHFTDIPAGPLRLRHVMDLCPYPNRLAAAIVTGRALRDWIEVAASQFHTLAAPAPSPLTQPLRDPVHPGHAFDVLFGLEYGIDPTGPPRFDPDGTDRDPQAGRARDIRLDGRPIDPDDRVLVAMTGYRAQGGGAVPGLVEPVALDLPLVRDALVDYLAGDLPEDPIAAAPWPWRFDLPAPVRVRVRTGPDARAHLDELAGHDPAAGALDDEGFLLLDLTLGT
jgi:2',3'-cyclic-nucleotide 2'-phosphodiesterase/3'-nucleotidase